MSDNSKTVLEDIIKLAQDEIKRIDGVPDDNTIPEYPAEKIILSYFMWQSGRITDPLGLPLGMRRGVGSEGGQTTVQWKLGDQFILHAVFPSSANTVSGNQCKWYHFTRTGTIYPSLSTYGWRESKSTPPFTRFVRYS